MLHYLQAIFTKLCFEKSISGEEERKKKKRKDLLHFPPKYKVVFTVFSPVLQQQSKEGCTVSVKK